MNNKMIAPVSLWEQTDITHCPKKECKGMLLTNPLFHECKCSDCEKYFVQVVKWDEVKKNE